MYVYVCMRATPSGVQVVLMERTKLSTELTLLYNNRVKYYSHREVGCGGGGVLLSKKVSNARHEATLSRSIAAARVLT